VGIVNRRNAVAGWIVWKLARRTARKKAQAVAPHALDAAARRPKALFAFMLAAGAGLATFLRRRRGSEEESA
jgi:hypothetical protein